MYNCPLVGYIYSYCRYDHHIPTSDRRGIGGTHATQFNLHDVLVAICQSFCSCDSTAHKFHCTDDQSFPNADRLNDFVWFRADKPPKGDIVDSRPAQPGTILCPQDGLWNTCVVLLWELQLETKGICLPSNGLLRVSDKVFHRNQANLVIVGIKYRWVGVDLICIPATIHYYVNNGIDQVIFNRFRPNLPEA